MRADRRRTGGHATRRARGAPTTRIRTLLAAALSLVASGALAACAPKAEPRTGLTPEMRLTRARADQPVLVADAGPLDPAWRAVARPLADAIRGFRGDAEPGERRRLLALESFARAADAARRAGAPLLARDLRRWARQLDRGDRLSPPTDPDALLTLPVFAIPVALPAQVNAPRARAVDRAALLGVVRQRADDPLLQRLRDRRAAFAEWAGIEPALLSAQDESAPAILLGDLCGRARAPGSIVPVRIEARTHAVDGPRGRADIALRNAISSLWLPERLAPAADASMPEAHAALVTPDAAVRHRLLAGALDALLAPAPTTPAGDSGRALSAARDLLTHTLATLVHAWAADEQREQDAAHPSRSSDAPAAAAPASAPRSSAVRRAGTPPALETLLAECVASLALAARGEPDPRAALPPGSARTLLLILARAGAIAPAPDGRLAIDPVLAERTLRDLSIHLAEILRDADEPLAAALLAPATTSAEVQTPAPAPSPGPASPPAWLDALIADAAEALPPPRLAEHVFWLIERSDIGTRRDAPPTRR